MIHVHDFTDAEERAVREAEARELLELSEICRKSADARNDWREEANDRWYVAHYAKRAQTILEGGYDLRLPDWINNRVFARRRASKIAAE